MPRTPPSAQSQPAAAATDTPSFDTPAPPEGLQVTLVTVLAGVVLHRVHLDAYAADQFNRGVAGNARFSPIQDDGGNPIPTLYAGTTMACALMESVFHDVPHGLGFKTLDKAKLERQRHSTIEVLDQLELVDLGSVSLRKLGIQRKQLIDTEKDQYPITRQWAQAIYRQCPRAQGLVWVSRQDDHSKAFVIFGNRVASGTIRQTGESRDLLHAADAYSEVVDMASRIGVHLVDGNT